MKTKDARLKLALEAANQGIYDFDMKTGKVEVTPEFANMLGYDPKAFEFCFEKWKESLHPDDRERVLQTFNDYVSGKIENYRVEFRLKTASGGWKWIMSIGKIMSSAPDGTPLRMLGTHTDIDDRKALEEKLNAREERLAMFLETMPIGLSENQVLCDENAALQDFVFLEVNDYFEKYSGLKKTDILNHCASEVFPEFEKVKPDLARLYSEVANTKEEKVLEIYFPPFKGFYKVTAFSRQKGRFFTIFENISEKKRSERMMNLRLRLHEIAQDLPLKDWLKKMLDEVCEISESKIGFYHFLLEDQKTLSLQAWSSQTLETFCSAATDVGLYDIDNAGIWADCIREKKSIIHNDYKNAPNRRGLPPGHAEVIREAVVPVFRNGKIVSILGVGNKCDNYTNEDVRILSYIADLTWELVEKRKDADDLLRIKTAIDNTVDAIGISTADGHHFFQNKAFTELFGYELEHFKRNSPKCLYADEKHAEEVFAAIMAGKEWSGECEMKNHQGTRIKVFLRANAVKDDSGKILGLVGIHTDLSKFDEIRKTLADAEKKFFKVLMKAPIPMCLVNSKEEIEFPNEKFLSLFGYQSSDIPTLKEWWPLAYPDCEYRAEVFRTWGEAVQKAQKNDTDIEPIEYIVSCKNGTKKNVLISGIVIGKELLATFIDMTDVRKAEQELVKLNESLKRSNKELEQFAYVASHDLQEPLRMVASYTQLLAERYEGKLDERANVFINYAVDGAKRMQSLIDDLLALSRVGTRGSPFSEMDCNKLLEDVLHSIGHRINETNTKLCLEKLPVLIADYRQIFQVFQNLILNSIKFRSDSPPEIKISAAENGEKWLFKVEDNGIGIDEQFFEKVFVIFQRLHTRQKYPGSGIGLSIVKKIIERHQGEIWLDSSPGRGTRVFFTIPKCLQRGEE